MDRAVLLNPRLRGVIWRTSAATALLGLTEPLFVPVYWNPPSLFELAQRSYALRIVNQGNTPRRRGKFIMHAR